MRCGLGGLPPVVVTPFGRLGVGSNHQVEAASLGGSSGLGVGRHDIGRLNAIALCTAFQSSTHLPEILHVGLLFSFSLF